MNISSSAQGVGGVRRPLAVEGAQGVATSESGGARARPCLADYSALLAVPYLRCLVAEFAGFKPKAFDEAVDSSANAAVVIEGQNAVGGVSAAVREGADAAVAFIGGNTYEGVFSQKEATVKGEFPDLDSDNGLFFTVTLIKVFEEYNARFAALNNCIQAKMGAGIPVDRRVGVIYQWLVFKELFSVYEGFAKNPKALGVEELMDFRGRLQEFDGQLRLLIQYGFDGPAA